MLIKVLGPGCAKCKEVEKVINVVVQESGSSAKVEKVTDFKEMMALGVMSSCGDNRRHNYVYGAHSIQVGSYGVDSLSSAFHLNSFRVFPPASP